MGVPWDPAEPARNSRLGAPEQLTGPLAPIAMGDALAVILDVDALGERLLPGGDRLTALVLDALSQVGVEIVIVATLETDRAATLQCSIPRARRLEVEHVIARLREEPRGFHAIAITNDLRLLAALGPDDRGLMLTGRSDSSHGVLPGEISMRAVLWWLVGERAARHGA